MGTMHRKDRQRDESFAWQVFSTCREAYLATINEDGSPYVVPISPVVLGETLYFHCALQGKKLDNLRREPRVAVSCAREVSVNPEAFTTHYESAVLEGLARLVEDPEEKRRALIKLCEKYSPGLEPEGLALMQRLWNATSVVCILPSALCGKANPRRDSMRE